MAGRRLMAGHLRAWADRWDRATAEARAFFPLISGRRPGYKGGRVIVLSRPLDQRSPHDKQRSLLGSTSSPLFTRYPPLLWPTTESPAATTDSEVGKKILSQFFIQYILFSFFWFSNFAVQTFFLMEKLQIRYFALKGKLRLYSVLNTNLN